LSGRQILNLSFFNYLNTTVKLLYLLLLSGLLFTVSCKKKLVLDTYHTFHDEEIQVKGDKFSKVYFHNSTLGFLTNLSSELYKTADGGSTWTKINSDFSSISNIYIKDTSVGFLTSNGSVYKTTDAGTTFTLVHSGSGILDIDFADANVGYGCGSNGGTGRVIKTIDGGDTWFTTF